MEKKEILEIIRKVVKPEKIKIEDYKTSSIRSVMFGQRNNDAILKSCIKKAIEEIEEMKSKLVYYEYTMYIKNIQPKNEDRHPFVEMDLKQKIEYLCKMKLKEIQELKKDLIRLSLFEDLEHEVKEFLKDLKPNHLKMLRYTRRF
jgi:hypothetical protein